MRPIPDWLAPYKNEWLSIGGIAKLMRSSNVPFQTWLRGVTPRLRCVVTGRAQGALPDVRKYLVKHVWAMAQAHSVVLVSTETSGPADHMDKLRLEVQKLRQDLAEARRPMGRPVIHQVSTPVFSPSLAVKLLMSRAPSMAPGVYFLIAGGCVVYIGQSGSVLGRMAGHSDKLFDDVRMIEVPDGESRLRLERALIAEFAPKYNIMGTWRTPPKTAKVIADYENAQALSCK